MLCLCLPCSLFLHTFAAILTCFAARFAAFSSSRFPPRTAPVPSATRFGLAGTTSPATPPASQVQQPPRVAHNDGWSFTQWEPASRSAFKPGVEAAAPGASLALQVDTSATLEPSVWLSYLTSYEGMGRARLECARCACAPAVLDARSRARQSTQERREVRVTPHARCELRLAVLNDSEPAHRFKLFRLVVEGEGPRTGE